MSKSFLITRPEHDDTTHYLSNWSKQILRLADNKGIKFFDLHKIRANLKEVQGIISKKNPELIIFNGHGNTNLITGHNSEILIKLGKNENLLNSRIIYAISCKSAKELGPKCKAKAFIGYDDDFVFVYEPNNITHPLEDKTAGLFLKPSNELMSSLIKGNSAGEAYMRSQKLLRENFNKLLTSEASAESAGLARYVLWDMRHQVCIGDKEAFF